MIVGKSATVVPNDTAWYFIDVGTAPLDKVLEVFSEPSATSKWKNAHVLGNAEHIIWRDPNAVISVAEFIRNLAHTHHSKSCGYDPHRDADSRTFGEEDVDFDVEWAKIGTVEAITGQTNRCTCWLSRLCEFA